MLVEGRDSERQKGKGGKGRRKKEDKRWREED